MTFLRMFFYYLKRGMTVANALGHAFRNTTRNFK